MQLVATKGLLQLWHESQAMQAQGFFESFFKAFCRVIH